MLMRQISFKTCMYVCTRVLAPFCLVLLYALHPMQWADIIFLRAQLVNFEHGRCKLKINGLLLKFIHQRLE